MDYSSYKCLIVDDNKINRKIMTLFLKKMGFQDIDIATDGSSALKLVNEQQYDLIILDLFMPVMDGFEFLKKYVTLNKRKPDIIVHTSAVCEDIYQICKQLGVIYFLDKPVDKNVLAKLVKEVIKNYKIN